MKMKLIIGLNLPPNNIDTQKLLNSQRKIVDLKNDEIRMKVSDPPWTSCLPLHFAVEDSQSSHYQKSRVIVKFRDFNKRLSLSFIEDGPYDCVLYFRTWIPQVFIFIAFFRKMVPSINDLAGISLCRQRGKYIHSQHCFLFPFDGVYFAFGIKG